MELICDEGTVFGEKYFTIQPKGWMANGDNMYWNDMVKWVVETYGTITVSLPEQRWYVNNARFWFRDKKDLEWFILRWS